MRDTGPPQAVQDEFNAALDEYAKAYTDELREQFQDTGDSDK